MGADTKVEVLLLVKDVPEGAVVTKPTGEKQYRVRDKIQVHGEHPETKERIDTITLGGCRFLVSVDGDASINCIGNDTKVKWKTSLKQLAGALGCWVDEIEDK